MLAFVCSHTLACIFVFLHLSNMKRVKINSLIKIFQVLQRNNKREKLSEVIEVLSPEVINSILETIYNVVFNMKFTEKIASRKKLNELQKKMRENKKEWMHILTHRVSVKRKREFMKSQSGGGGSVSNVLQTLISVIPSMLLALI